ncbi:MAG: sugar phosphate nucleotidyltransferase, partial [Fervidicoccaceae archaeon]
MRTRAVILAAGRGERLWPLTSTRPKPLLPVLGRPLLQHHIEALKSAGIAEVDLVVGAGAESVLKTAQELGAIARPVYQPVQLGTGDAVRLALGERSGEVVVVYSDVYVKPSVYSSIIEKISSSSAQLVVAARVADVSLYGEVSVDSAGRLVKISEKPPERRGGLVFAGLLYAEADELRKALKGLGASPR